MSETESCRQPITSAELLDYLAGVLEEGEEDRVESHVFRCHTCSSEAERLAGLLSAVVATVPPVLAPSRFAALERQGRIGAINAMRPGETADVFYPEAGRLLVHRLGGAPLSGAQRVDLDLSNTSGEVFRRFEKVPFDPTRGEVLVACQRHFADLFPRDIVCSLEAVSGEQREEVARYTIHHHLT